MARFSSAMPGVGVYFVKFSSIAAWAAVLMAPGVGKSGSPAPKSITSIPARRSLSTVAVTCIVAELAIRFVRSASRVIGSAFYFLPLSFCLRPFTFDLLPFVFDARANRLRLGLLAQPLLDQVGHQATHAAAEREDFLDQPRADVCVLFRGHHEHRLDVRVEPLIH